MYFRNSFFGLIFGITFYGCINFDEGKQHAQYEKDILYSKFSVESSILNASNIEDVELISSQYSRLVLSELISQNPISILHVVSYESCSTCRERTIFSLNEIYMESSEVFPVYQVVCEDNGISKADLRKIEKNSQALTKYPVFYDVKGELLPLFRIKSQDLPVFIIVSSDGEIMFAHRTHEQTEVIDNAFLVMIASIYEAKKD